MKASIFNGVHQPLVYQDVPDPAAGPGQILIRVKACGVCRTDLHIVDGDLTQPKLPLIPGHEIVGEVLAMGAGVSGFQRGERVGVPWLGFTCGTCRYCLRGQENLCEKPGFTGYTIDGGFAEMTTADARYCFHLPPGYDDVHAAPLMCAGLIGYRSYRMTGEGVKRLGLFGFGAAAHITAQVASQSGQQVYAFTRPGDLESQHFAMENGAVWAGGSNDSPPEALDAAIIYAPVGGLVPAALKAVDKGGSVVCAGIHMSDIPSFAYDLLWEERVIRSVANLTRQDGLEFLEMIARHPVETRVNVYPLADANQALDDLRAGRLQGAAVLVMDGKTR
jgi:propanol-preferring alcohol dehydrogenase